ncbi:MAG TPA: EamA family transporter [Marmoricola sp.]|nr:EamA family transporter [Marmoricola sp.]
MTVVFALASAILYGVSDFVGGVASRRTSVWPVGLLSCSGSALGCVIVASLTRGSPSGSDLLYGAVAGIGAGAGTAFLYRGLAAGRMGVVAPVSGVGAVIVPLVVAVSSGERPALIGWVGIVLALPGIWLVSREPVVGRPSTGFVGSGLLDGVLAGLGFGALFASLGKVSPDAGYWPLAVAEAVSVVAMAGVAVAVGGDPTPRRGAELWGLLPGALATCAVVFFVLATRHGLLSISAVISSLYPAFTVLLAIGVLREHVHRLQAVGLALCAAAVVLVSLA